MHKYAPLLAFVYAQRFTALEIIQLHKEILQEMKEGNFSKLELLHHLSSGMKAFFTKSTFEGMDLIRDSVGAAGFLNYNGLGPLISAYSPSPTVEGDSTVMF